MTTTNETTKSKALKPLVRVVRRAGYARSNLSGLIFELGYVTIRREVVLVFRGNGVDQWITADPKNFNR